MTASNFSSGTPESLRDVDFQYIRDLTKRHSAIDLDDSKRYLVHSRLMPLARSEGFSSVSALINDLRTRPVGDLHVGAVECLATSETSFFRDHHPFEALREHIIPEFLRSRRNTRTLNIWCAACASGQEPMSVAMLLREHFPTLNGWNVQIIATDLSHKMVERTKGGLYRQHEVNRGLPAKLLIRYFEQQKNRWKAKSELLSMIRCFQHNLAADWYSIPMVDVLFMRNILIYFNVETRKAMLAKVRKVLRRDGYLLLGTAETALNLDSSFSRVKIGKSVFYEVKMGGGT